MVETQLAIINKELPSNFAFHEGTVTIHLISAYEYTQNVRNHAFEKFSLLDDSGIECLPSLSFEDKDVFKISFTTKVSQIYEYEISFFHVENPFKLIYVKTVDLGYISNQSKYEIQFPPGSSREISQCIAFCTEICRKNVPRVVSMNSSQITDCSLLFENNALSNFKIIVQKTEFRVHKEILAAKSPVFLAMFDNEMKEKREKQMTIEDLDSNVVQEMLRYIYVNTVKDLESHAENLLRAADKYDIPKLKLLCSEQLSRSLAVDNSLHLLELADKFHESALKERALQFIQSNIKKILQTENYKTWRKTATVYLMADVLELVAHCS